MEIIVSSIYTPLIGQRVIVRAHMAGVYAGVVTEAHADGVTLAAGARQIHYWARGGSTHQIAERGIGGNDCRVTAPSSAPRILAGGAQVVDVIALTETAWLRIQAHPEWTGAL